MSSDLPPEGVAPSKPAAPRRPVTPTQQARPEPLEADEAEIIAPNPGPDPEEVLPSDAPTPFEAEPHAGPRDSYEALGAAAAANAALNAGGAPTPLAGVPKVAGEHAAPEGLDQGEPFQPRFEGDQARAGAQAARRAMKGVESGLVNALGGDDAPYAPATEPANADAIADAPAAPARRPGRAWPLVLVGLLTIGALGYGAYLMLGTPEDIEIPAQQVVAERPERAVDPVALEDPTPFLQAIPATPGLWAMTSAQTIDPESAMRVSGRLAEVHRLTYSDGDSQVRVAAYQFYTQAAAETSLAAFADDAEVTAHTVAGTDVGLEAVTTEGGDATVAWTNGSALFIADGPAAAVANLVRELGL